MEFKQYPSYKNSGVEWLGDVPDEWDIYPFWHLFNRKEITNKTQEQLLSVYLDRGVILHSEGGGMVHKPADNLEKYQLVEVNDFVMNNQQAWRGSVGVSPYKGIVSPAYLIFSFNKKICAPKFFKYFLRDKGVVDQFMIASMSVGTIQRQVKWHLLKTIQLSIPSLIEQNTIANFLDTETARIDNLISKQEKLIELLEEQRKSIISHAVTKGLNPNAPMKDSGVEWLGQVPEHWNISKLRYYLDGIKDGTHGTHVSTTEGQLLLSGKNIKNGKLVITDNERKISLEDHQKITANGFPKKGDLLINVVGTIGQSCIYELDTPISFQRSVCFLRANNKLKPNFLQRILESNLSQNQLKILTNKSTIGGVYMGDLVELIIPVVPIKEQNKITDYLDREIQEIVNCIDKQKLLIEKLKEYRSSIISHAVTGKIDVREFDA